MKERGVEALSTEREVSSDFGGLGCRKDLAPCYIQPLGLFALNNHAGTFDVGTPTIIRGVLVPGARGDPWGFPFFLILFHTSSKVIRVA